MRRRTLPAVVEDDERGAEWLADAGTYRGVFAEIAATGKPFTGDVSALRRQRLAEAQAWCEARGLDYLTTVRDVRRQQHDERKTP